MRDVRLGRRIIGVSYVQGEWGPLSASQRRGNCEGRTYEDVGIDYEASCRIPTRRGRPIRIFPAIGRKIRLKLEHCLQPIIPADP